MDCYLPFTRPTEMRDRPISRKSGKNLGQNKGQVHRSANWPPRLKSSPLCACTPCGSAHQNSYSRAVEHKNTESKTAIKKNIHRFSPCFLGFSFFFSSLARQTHSETNSYSRLHNSLIIQEINIADCRRGSTVRFSFYEGCHEK